MSSRDKELHFARLGDLCISVTDGDWIETKDQSDTGYRLLQIGNIGVGRFRESGKSRFVSEETFKRLNCSKIELGDVLIARMPDPTGRAWCVDEEIPPSITSVDVAIARVDPEKLNAKYLSYYFNSPLTLARIAGMQTGSTRQRIKRSDLLDLQIPLPALNVQRAIANVLGAVDRKIELNNLSTTTLEKILQTFFKSWFIDFDPVKAKMTGEKPVGMDDGTAALFPDSMQDSEIGPIPEGWVLTKVEDLLDRVKVKPLPKSTVVKSLGRTLVLEQGDSLIAGFVDDDATVETSVASPRFIFGDHTCRMYLSTLPFSVFPNTIVLTSTSTNPYWAYWATRDIQKFESYRRHWMELAFRSVAVPSQEVADKWGELASAIHSQLDALMIECRQLADLRDALLPRLISGELQIPEEMLVS